MKTALLHYWLTNMRGGENVLAGICDLYPDADIFTHAFNPSKISDRIKSHRISETFIGKLPFAKTSCQKYLPLMPSAVSTIDLSGYDLIISSESGPIKGIRKPSGTVHICYCHTPMRYVWDMYDDYYKSSGLCAKAAMSIFRNYLRKYDLKSADSVDFFIANSNFIAGRISRIYNRPSVVVYPPVDTSFYAQADFEKKDYYLFAGQLISYKNPDLAVEACKKMNRRLVVAGEGPMKEKLMRSAGSNVTFTGRVDNETFRRLYGEAKALIFPGVEDFGIIPLEAQATGTPVIALGKGGALETVCDGRTGVFFNEPSVESLCGAIERFESMSFEIPVMKANAGRFGKDVFNERFSEAVRRFLASSGKK